jgi:mono/diheme cytochrome c family protein
MRHFHSALLLNILLGLASAAHAQGVSEGAPLGTRPAVPTTEQAAPNQPLAGDAQRGQTLFVADGCYECHGYVGQGSVRTGPALAPRVIPMAAFQAQLRKPMDRMPPYTDKVLPEADLRDIYAYLQSLPKPPNVADLAILQP